MRIEKILKEFVKECKNIFGKDLVSVVLFGSRVKGYAKEYSDYDILIISKNLPDIKERFDLISDVEAKFYEKYKIKISSLLVEPEEIFEPINPLLFGVLSGYKVIFGNNNFKRNLERAKMWIEKLNPTYIEGAKEWKVKDLI